ncbi:MAG: TRAP transporter large permease subunit [Alphaproteobacteria bacterium]|nr:TRAP transporter large permease subunit [Alphaproteobacteria bacterium]MCB9930831.1 TRAP transporter large permease subunit [Alphaproteobacteria bacterium]
MALAVAAGIYGVTAGNGTVVGISAVVLAVLVTTLALGVWVAVALFSVGIISLAVFRSMPVEKLLAQLTFNVITTPELISLPLFILMAEILFHSRLSASLFSGLAPWTNRLPGRLLHVNVLGCTMFAAISGSSAATTATVGRITLSELFGRGYSKDLAMGSLAGAGTLGLLIPPSIVLIIYGVLAETSILKLFIAGVIPGLLLAAGYMSYIGFRASVTAGMTPPQDAHVTWAARIYGLRHLGPVVFLILAVLGSMYGGIASPSEAAAVGVLGALIVSGLQGSLTLANLVAACLGAVRTVSMIGMIVAGAYFLSVAMGFLGVPRAIATEIAALGLSPFALIMLLLVFYAILGCVLEGMSSIVMTLPITLPLVLHAGFDKIWFGIFLVIVVEMAQITPPVGFNLFVIQGMTGEPIGRIARATIPFFLIMVALAVLITVWPGIATYLPSVIELHG